MMPDKQWFEEWFNSPYYHCLYANRSEHEAEQFIKAIAAHLQMPAGAQVLDVACGKGRHSKTLAGLGFNVTGIDLAENSITEAQKCSSSNLQFAVWDMRRVYQPLHFNYVFNLFSSFGYFDSADDDKAAIQAMYDNLTPGGMLVLDYLNTEWAVKHLKPREIIPRGDIHFHITKRVEGGFIKKRIEFLAEGQNYSFEEKLKVINRLKFEEMLQAAGFTLQNVLGDYDLQPFNAATSARLILIARKNG